MFKSDTAETQPQIVYCIGQVTYVPHYRNKDVFVGPGYPRHTQAQYSAKQLIAAGASQSVYSLWPRSITGIVNANNL